MLKLMRLEFRKNRVWRYVRSALIANFIILGFVCLITYTPDNAEDVITSYDMAFAMIDLFARATYIVFAAVLLSKIIIEEFRSKTATVLFMYPISRKKLMTAKLLVVALFTMAAHLVSSLVVGAGFYLVTRFAEVIPEPLTGQIVGQALLRASTSALATGCMGLIPLYFGMRKYSVSTTIVSSLIVMTLISQSTNDFSLYSIMAVPIGLAFMGTSVACLAIRNIGHIDMIK